jgi:hypothetical protein
MAKQLARPAPVARPDGRAALVAARAKPLTTRALAPTWHAARQLVEIRAAPQDATAVDPGVRPLAHVPDQIHEAFG